MSKPTVNLSELLFAFQDHSGMMRHYLERETGRAIDLPADLGYSDDPEADEIENDDGSRFIGIPSESSRVGYQDMADYIETVTDPREKSRLAAAIKSKHPFRAFHEAIGDPMTKALWYRFRDERTGRRVMEWLQAEQIDVELEIPPEKLLFTGPPARPRLIELALTFAQAARKLPGVQRIALIGSITTDKPEPKDLDLLATIADDLDLTELATLSRRMSGQAGQFSRSAETFLADPRGRYIGRICKWKRCEPGARMACEAQHCARRHYLNDDLQSVKLPDAQIAAPPIELWPKVVRRINVPQDVEEGLLKPFESERLSG